MWNKVCYSTYGFAKNLVKSNLIDFFFCIWAYRTCRSYYSSYIGWTNFFHFCLSRAIAFCASLLCRIFVDSICLYCVWITIWSLANYWDILCYILLKTICPVQNSFLSFISYDIDWLVSVQSSLFVLLFSVLVLRSQTFIENEL